MKLPLAAPQLPELLAESGSPEKVFSRAFEPEVAGDYIHWDRLRHLEPPAGLDHKSWWLGIKLARMGRATSLPFRQSSGDGFSVSLSDSMLRQLHFLDREAAGMILGADQDDDHSIRHKHLHRSLVEEAMTSSQLEGASTTRRVAKEMLDTGRAPRDRSERMIFNNFAMMERLSGLRDTPLSPAMILEIHRGLMHDAMDEAGDAGRLRTSSDDIVIYDRADPSRVLHVPPAAGGLPSRLQAICDFANADTDKGVFLHPIVRAIVLHFMVGYDHPFCDGNGRTARALFYWSMLRSGYWLSEYVSISSVLRRAPAAYIRAYLHSESDGGDVSYFVAHQLGVIVEAVSRLRDYLARKSKERKQAEKLLTPAGNIGGQLNHRQRDLLLEALRQPDSTFTIGQQQKRQGITYATARADLLGLESLGLLLRRKTGRRFEFEPVVDLSSRLKRD